MQCKINKSAALVLGSGGAKGYAHIGAIKAIEESGYTITSIAGTSMGALVGGLYAAGKLREAYAWLKEIDTLDVFKLSDFKNIALDGLINGEYIFAVLHKFVGDVKIEDLPIPFCAIAADLDSGKEKVFTKGKLLDAIRASISMPVFFRPHKIGRKRYIDGGVVNGLPINRVKRHKGDVVIAINLDTYGETTAVQVKNEIMTSWFTRNDFINIFGALLGGVIPAGIAGRMASATILGLAPTIWDKISNNNILMIFLSSYYIALKQNKLAMVEQENPDVYLNVDLKGYSTRNFAEAEIISNLGYEQMKNKLQEQRQCQ